ncbi:citramalate synthase [Salinibacterium sp. dk2585]|uniref:citramalate synthase n=1 Tax=unclassified Salinibacterium TaxID=2632331 RepID=UPI0011C243F3|nr:MULTISPECIES: citramalate synthase [unclassified Salinibacterium]QEE60399.1 citramalate synthase [Salinibacterium sp. dk2585]TXK55472.1 citramalate synthase [Salinibacterium sp. dk5596]
MTKGRPTISILEEGMREGMQIESADIPAAEKIRLLDALSATGLKRIHVGAFVSPKWTPQMANVDEVIAGFTPVEGVTYTAIVLNQKGAERRDAYGEKLSLPDPTLGRSKIHLCDVFVRRNINISQQDEIDALGRAVATAKEKGVTHAEISINAAWGSNWLGEFDEEERMRLLQLQHDAWTSAGVPVTRIHVGDPMSWNTPSAVRSMMRRLVATWPEVHDYHLHLHDARGMAMLSAYVAMEELDERHTLQIDTAIGGMGGCPYCGNGRATRMIPTEDFVHLLESEGIETGVDLPKLIEAGVIAEEVVGHELWSKVTAAGPRPTGAAVYAMDMPFIETFEQASHFRNGPSVYEGAMSPYREPVKSPARDEYEARLAAEKESN